MLGVVDNIMCLELRERVLNDVGKSNMKERCFDMIERLKAEADDLISSNAVEMSEAMNIYRTRVFTDMNKQQI